jgi:Fe-S-cluster containining protein
VNDLLCPGGDLLAALAPYRTLRDQVDQLCGRIVTEFAGQIRCRAGCAACCLLQGVLPVEAASLALAWRDLPEASADRLRGQAQLAAAGERCPLLDGDLCSLYAARPIICRTHGLPLLIEEAAGTRVDRCPLNFTGLTTLPGSAVIHLERLNCALVAANRHYLATCFPHAAPAERIPLRQLLTFPAPGNK